VLLQIEMAAGRLIANFKYWDETEPVPPFKNQGPDFRTSAHRCAAQPRPQSLGFLQYDVPSATIGPYFL
jgi:hypothetical protein